MATDPAPGVLYVNGTSTIESRDPEVAHARLAQQLVFYAESGLRYRYGRQITVAELRSVCQQVLLQTEGRS